MARQRKMCLNKMKFTQINVREVNSQMITPILLCGGSGTRLWPLSRQSYPKQFAPLLGETSLFQASSLRMFGKIYNAPIVVTNSDFRFIVTEQLSSIGIDPGTILIEPEGRNTAPAILATALLLHKQDPNALMLVAPSDHVVPDIEAFQETIEAGIAAARGGQLVTFGIAPSHPETGYGYLEVHTSDFPSKPTPLEIKRFVEKPNQTSAEKMLASGKFLWNSGIFLFTAEAILTAFKKYAPNLIDPVQSSIDLSVTDLGFIRLDPRSWKKTDNISIDYAVMERANNLSVVPFGGSWSDLGDWDAVWRESNPDHRGIVVSENATAIDCEDTLLRSEDSALEVVGIGLKDIIAVAMPDAVLVAHNSKAQDVKQAVAVLANKSVAQAKSFPKDHRPWGWFERLVLGDRFQVKRILVHPGAALSLQSHHHRSEHWIVVEGTAKVTIDNKVELVTENESVYIPLGAVHRMENPGKVPMVLIEVQTGSYLGEDDIVRYEDIYSRK